MRLWLVGGLVGLCTMPAVADLYRYHDKQGNVLITDTPVQGRRYKLFRRYATPNQAYRQRNSHTFKKRRQQYDYLINAAAKANRLPPRLVHAVVRAESSYQPDAVSHKGAMGLMQLMPRTAKELGVDNAFDPKQNLLGGTRYLRQLLLKFNHNIRLALAAYNAGENAVIRAGYRVPPYPETQNYVDKVLNFYKAES
jgi:soluble lytic murein transglycosylase-like protein